MKEKYTTFEQPAVDDGLVDMKIIVKTTWFWIGGDWTQTHHND